MTGDSGPKPFVYEANVDPGEKRHVRYEVGETYLGDPIEIPVTVVNGEHDGPTAFLTAAVHGDELNGVKVLQEVADGYDPAGLHGTLVCVHVANVPGYLAQQRDIPIYDVDLNRSFPGREGGNTGSRIADEIYRRFIAPCDLGIDFHTSTRNRTTMYHVRADVQDPGVERIARAFGANVILSGAGDDGSLRKTATNAGIPTITVEMGKAHRFQPVLIDRARKGVRSVLAEFDVLPGDPVDWPGWTKVTRAGGDDKSWIRADQGGLVDMEWGPTPLVHEGETMAVISDHFREEETVVEAPFTGIIVGVLENPVAQPGHPLFHLVRIDADTRDEIEREIERGEFDGYRALGLRWIGDDEELLSEDD